MAWGYRTDMVTSRIRGKSAGRRPKHLYIEEWMNYRDLSDERMAGRLNVARETVTRWRNEQGRLDPYKIAGIAKALDIEAKELWDPPGPKPTPQRPSIDAMLTEASDGEVRRLAEMAAILLKTGT